MTDDDELTGTPDERIVGEAHERFDRCVDWESFARQNAKADARFAHGDSRNKYQWGDDALRIRGDRPTLTTNKTRQHNLQIVNDARQHKAQVKVSPTGGGATYEAAQVFSACVRRIEAQSKATDAYSTAAYYQVEQGIGYLRVVAEYVGEKSFNQDIFIRREDRPDSIYIDPDAKEYDKSDMRFAFKFLDMPRDDFISEYGRDKLSSTAPLDNRGDMWSTKHHVRVAEYFRRVEKTDHLHQLADGTIVVESKMAKGWKQAAKPNIVRSRDIGRPEVEWYKIAGHEIIDRKIFPCKYIPIVPVIGEEFVIDGIMDRRGHTRALLDPQRIYNYASSAAAEFVALQTKTPYIAAAEAIEGRVEDWANANTTNKAVLVYNGIGENGQQLTRPEREKPPVSAPAYLDLMNQAKDEMMMASGQYQANFGQPSNERSGVAIEKRQREGDNATYHFIDNQAKAIRQIGRICLDMIPRIYDVARVIKIMAEDGTQSDVHVDPNLPEAHAHVQDGPKGPQMIDPDRAKQADNDAAVTNVRLIFNPNVGDYDVEADVGPPFATQREEAVNAVTQMVQADPALMAVAGDIMVKNMDWPGADVLAERLKRMVPPQALGGPSPQEQQLQQQLQATHAHAMQATGAADNEIAHLKAQIALLTEQAKDKSDRTKTDDYRAETDRLEAVTAADPSAAKVLVRSMLSALLGMPALPIMQEHDAADAAHAQAIAPPDPAAMNGAGGAPAQGG